MTMRRILPAMLLLVASSSVAADFAAGVEAYERGDYATALREFRPLADQGDARAQVLLGVMYIIGKGVPEAAAKPCSGTARPPSRETREARPPDHDPGGHDEAVIDHRLR